MIINLKLLERDIQSEPEVLDSLVKEIWRHSEDVVPKITNIKNVVLCGCGDSFFSAIAGGHMFRYFSGVPSFAEEAYEFAKYGLLQEKTLFIAISASGRTRTTIEAAGRAKQSGALVLAITCNKECPLAEVSDSHIHLNIRDSTPIPILTSMGILTMLGALSILLGFARNVLTADKYEAYRRDLMMIGDSTKRAITTQDKIGGVADTLEGKRNIYLVGGGPNYASALFGMAKLRELNVSHSIAFELEEFLHYGNIPLNHGGVVILIACGESVERAQDAVWLLKKMGVEVFLIGNKNIGNVHQLEIPDIPEPLTVIPSLAILHQIAIVMAKGRYGEKLSIKHGDYVSRIIRVTKK